MFTIGVDYGTNSVRALVVRAADGLEYGSKIVNYPSGTQGVMLDPKDGLLARQNPADHLYGLEESMRGALAQAAEAPDFDPAKVIGIGVDTTGSSPMPVDAHNRPLAFDPRFEGDFSAQCWLWKDHTSWREAAKITETAAKIRPQYIAKCGGVYSSEWFWSKIWRCLNVAPKTFEAAYSWVEIADWLPSVLAGVTDPLKIKRGICAAGHKALYADDWGGLPDKEFLTALDPRLAPLRDRLYERAYDATEPAGALSPEWADKLGLKAGIPIAIGEFDVHYGAIGSGVSEGTLVKVIGTSTCDCAVVPLSKSVADIPGVCGIVKGAILPGYFGIEAGQSAVGDIFKWWVEGVCRGDAALHAELTREASAQKPGQAGLVALDWNNGNRTILVDQRLTGLILGQDLYTTRAEIYRALIEATAFGARAIIERIEEYGVRIDRIVCTGGIAEKNPLLMQIYADVTGRTMHVAASSQTCALGSAVSAAVLAGAHPDFATAEAAMTSLRPEQYDPIAENAKVYDQLYALYRNLHDAFGGLNRSADLSGVMKTLLDIKCAQRDAPGQTKKADMIALANPEIWFICGSQHLYGPGPLEQVAANAREIAGALANSKALPLKTVLKPVAKTPDEIAALCTEANANPNCAGLILWMHTFSPSKMWIRGLNILQKPFLHLHTQFGRDLPWSTIDMDFMNLNQSAHGDREAGFIHTRMRLGRKVVVGHWSDPEVHERIGAWMCAARAWADWQGAKFCRFGDNMRQVAVTDGDKVSAEMTFGFATNTHGIGDLAAVVNAISDAEVEKVAAEYDDRYTVASEMRKGGARRDEMLYGVRLELGLRAFLGDAGFKGFTDTFEDLHGLKTLPGLGPQRLMEDGLGFAGEGDWKTVALVRAMKVMAEGKRTSFMEDYTYHMEPGNHLVLGSHMLEVCPSIAVGKPSLEIHPLSIGGKADPVRLVFDAPAGPALNASLIDLGSRFRLIVNEVTAVDHPPLPKLPVARAVWECKPDFKTACGAWILAGGAHHTGYSYVVTYEMLEDFATMAGIECLRIGDGSTLAGIKQDLRTNDVYYYLSRGFRA